jgi:hypothetical protein
MQVAPVRFHCRLARTFTKANLLQGERPDFPDHFLSSDGFAVPLDGIDRRILEGSRARQPWQKSGTGRRCRGRQKIPARVLSIAHGCPPSFSPGSSASNIVYTTIFAHQALARLFFREKSSYYGQINGTIYHRFAERSGSGGSFLRHESCNRTASATCLLSSDPCRYGFGSKDCVGGICLVRAQLRE